MPGMGAGLPKYVTVNLNDLEALGLEEGEEISLETLIADGLLNPSGRDRSLPLKVGASTGDSLAFTQSRACLLTEINGIAFRYKQN